MVFTYVYIRMIIMIIIAYNCKYLHVHDDLLKDVTVLNQGMATIVSCLGGDQEGSIG